jgi:hypothetical protein
MLHHKHIKTFVNGTWEPETWKQLQQDRWLNCVFIDTEMARCQRGTF